MKLAPAILLALATFCTQAAAQAGPLTGTYKFKTQDADNQIAILDLGNGTLKFDFFGSWPHINTDGEQVAHTGVMSGALTLKGNKALFVLQEYGDCTLLFSFVKDKVDIDYLGKGSGRDCGLGHNVEAEGQYRRTSRQKPKVQGW